MTDPVNNMSTFFMSQAQSVRQTSDIKAQAGDKAQLEEACRGFESIFVNYLMQKMRETIPEGGLIGGGQAEKIYTSMLDSEVSKTVSEQRGIGLARIMFEQMTAAQKLEEE